MGGRHVPEDAAPLGLKAERDTVSLWHLGGWAASRGGPVIWKEPHLLSSRSPPGMGSAVTLVPRDSSSAECGGLRERAPVLGHEGRRWNPSGDRQKLLHLPPWAARTEGYSCDVHRALCPPVPITPVRPSILVALESPRWQRSFRAPGCKPQASVPPQGRQRWGPVTTRHGCQGSWHRKPPQHSLSQRLGWMVHYTGPAGIEPAARAQNLCCQARQPRVGARIVLPGGRSALATLLLVSQLQHKTALLSLCLLLQ